MQLYNSMSRQVEPLEFAQEPVKLYVCGITPYDTTHLGHAFTYALVDVLVRYLEYRGHQVQYVQNVTDIDDDILRKAKSEGEDWRSLGNRWTAHFIRDMKAMNVRPPDDYPRASDVIPEIVEAVRALIDVGLAYEVGGSVYYRAEAWPEFGKLSHLPPGEMLEIANERGNNPDDPNKRDPLDFVLWQAQAPGEPAWESPWGPGRPGWHIECSTLVERYLGDTIDLHSGGADLLFPHHECEIAQIEPVTGKKPFVRHWMHTAMVQYEGEKMSKSLGNLIMIRDLLQEHSADAIRFYLAAHHYRQEWAYDAWELRLATTKVEELVKAATIEQDDTLEPALDASSAVHAFIAAMDDDLDTVMALNILRQFGITIQEAASAGRSVAVAQAELRKMAAVFGLRLTEDAPEARVLAGWDQHLERFS
ncbi:MAG: cysteine--tRNA ligase [Caldilineaceae bacterium]|nr:cysteine--tRNA ligase [Caldilineaceae bacterium]